MYCSPVVPHRTGRIQFKLKVLQSSPEDDCFTAGFGMLVVAGACFGGGAGWSPGVGFVSPVILSSSLLPVSKQVTTKMIS